MPSRDYNAIKASLLVTLLGFMVIFSFVFILLFVFKPSQVLRQEHHEGEHHSEVDLGRCLVGATIVGIILMILIRVFQSSIF
jgi:Na+-transporting methylmalonyl-CoA/oxaloacetate decarboxylase gamma subunit